MRLGDRELAIRTVRNHSLTRLKTELCAIYLYRYDVRLERHQIGDAADLRVRVTIRPDRQTCVTDVVVATQPFVRAEGPVLNGSERMPINVGTWNVPARREAGLVENRGPFSIGNDAVTMADHEMTGCLADVDAVVAVGSMAHDPFVLFVEGVHGRPGECNPFLQVSRVGGQVDVLPRPSRRALFAGSNGVPRRESEVGVPGGMLSALYGVWRDIALWEVGYRITARFEEQYGVLAIGDPGSAKAYAHPPAQRLGI